LFVVGIVNAMETWNVFALVSVASFAVKVKTSTSPALESVPPMTIGVAVVFDKLPMFVATAHVPFGPFESTAHEHAVPPGGKVV
jgi:hypothetical protein